MKQSILLILIILALLLTACGAPTPAEPEAPESPAPVETATPEPEPKPESNLIGISAGRDLSDTIAMKDHLEALGYEVFRQVYEEDTTLQLTQIKDMIDRGARVLIIDSYGCSVSETALDLAKTAGIPVIADRVLFSDSDAISYFCSFDYASAGELQGKYIVDTLGLAAAGDETFDIEFFCGDINYQDNAIFFDSMMDVLSPYLNAGILRCPSGQITAEPASSGGGDYEVFLARLENILSEYYDSSYPDVIVCTDDGLAFNISSFLEQYQFERNEPPEAWPIITGAGGDNIPEIANGAQAMTINMPLDGLAVAAAQMADKLMQGQEPPINDRETYRNSAGPIPSYLLAPELVTKDNWEDYLIECEACALEEAAKGKDDAHYGS